MGSDCSKPERDNKGNSFSTNANDVARYLEQEKKDMAKAATAVIDEREQKIHLHAEAKRRKKIQGRVLDFDDDFTAPVHPKGASDVVFLDRVLSSNFIFSDLSDGERNMLIDAMAKEFPSDGDTVIRQGDVGDFFYVVQKGLVSFVCDGKTVGSCRSGGSFGELALLYDTPRAATCIAGADTILWKVDQGTFRHLLARASRDNEKIIVEVLTKIDLFKDLDRHLIKKFADVLDTVKYNEGEKIVEKGQKGDVFYIVKSGEVRVHDIGLGDSSFDDVVREAGYWFGERALMTGTPRAATVTAMTEVDVFACNRNTFETTIGPLETVLGEASRTRFIKSVPIFAQSLLSDIEFDSLSSMLEVRNYEKGQKLADARQQVTTGCDNNPSLYIVKEGKLMITEHSGKIFFLGSGDYFGDKAVQADGEHVSKETCIVEEDTICWELKKTDIESVIGDVNRLGKPIAFTAKAYDCTLTIDDIKKHKMLGMGAFGKVWLATSRDTEKPYAMKTIAKRQLIDQGMVKNILREKKIMASLEHTFILPMIGSFQDENFLYLLLPCAQGGELFNVIHTGTRDGISNSSAQFYAACILEALGYMHARNIVYRDMKPENALIESDGYAIMCDFGFAKIVVDKSYTLCGTPEYLAPELIMSKGHDKAVDYWSYGVLIYEMLVGQSPFYVHGTAEVSLFKRIVMGKYQCPSSVSDSAKDVIKKLLTRRQASRFGNLSRGHQDIKDHAWFSDLDFDELNGRTLEAPWKPKLANPMDVSNFDDFSRVEREKHGGSSLSAAEQRMFEGFCGSKG